MTKRVLILSNNVNELGDSIDVFPFNQVKYIDFNNYYHMAMDVQQSDMIIMKKIFFENYHHMNSMFFIDSNKAKQIVKNDIFYKIARNWQEFIEYKLESESNLNTSYGLFKMYIFRSKINQKTAIALVRGNVRDKNDVLCRVHSSCITGDIFHSKHCDCGEQLAKSMSIIADKKEGVVIYLFQEGRGIGLANKIKAYDLQSIGHDTVDANRCLCLPDDLRSYNVVKDLLWLLEIRSINLLTNNPLKTQVMREAGVVIDNVINLKIPPNPINHRYLETKKERMRHDI